jgi:hypothetical protein
MSCAIGAAGSPSINDWGNGVCGRDADAMLVSAMRQIWRNPEINVLGTVL